MVNSTNPGIKQDKEFNAQIFSMDAESNPGERLYKQGKEQREKLEAKRMDLPEGCTFTPTVNKKQTTKTNSNSTSGTDGSVDRFTQLYQDAKKIEDKREERRKSSTPVYTFTPELNPKSKRTSLNGKSDEPAFEHLYKEAKKKQEKRKNDEGKYELSKCSFTPTINTKSKRKESKPLYNVEQEREKREKLDKKRRESEVAQCTFKPKISFRPRSAPVKKSKNIERGSIHERLHDVAKEREERVDKLREMKLMEEEKDCTFKPKISKKKINKDEEKKNGSIFERLYASGNRKDVMADREKKKKELEQSYGYKPKISSSNNKNSKNKSIFERLYNEREKKMEKVMEHERIKKEKEMEECTFTPKMSEESVELIKNDRRTSQVPIWKRLSDIDKESLIKEREKAKEMEELKECTFKPSISDSHPKSKNFVEVESRNIFDRLSEVQKDMDESTSRMPKSTLQMDTEVQSNNMEEYVRQDSTVKTSPAIESPSKNDTVYLNTSAIESNMVADSEQDCHAWALNLEEKLRSL